MTVLPLWAFIACSMVNFWHETDRACSMRGRKKFKQIIGNETWREEGLRRRLVDGIDTDVREMECQDMKRICLVHSFHC